MPLEDIKQARLEKLDKLRKAGVDPYPAKTWRTHRISQTLADFDALVEEKRFIVLVGRVMARREHGGSMFLDINDGSETIQIFVKKDTLGEREFELFSDTVDIGDFIEGYGSLFRTKKEERTLEVQRWRMLTKTLLPLPEKWHGLQDVEERFRKRYLDLLFNPDVKNKIEVRSKVIRTIHDFLDANGFLEVQTPTLQPLYGGASARPFKTHLNALDTDFFLRIAPELYLKRLLVGGFEAVYEFTTNFRNEGLDREHNPEFSAVEYYVAYKDYEWSMEFTEKLLEDVIKKVKGNTTIEYHGQKIQFSRPFMRESFLELLKRHANVDYEYMEEKDMRIVADKLGLKIEKTVAKAGLADEIFKKAVRQKLIQPTFVTDYPVELMPLAKRIDGSNVIAAFQFYAGGLELIRAYSELNDPLDQRARFEEQEDRRAKGDEEAQKMDEDFIESLEYGMPPATGWGLGLDRFMALLTDSHSIREVILFPLMRPSGERRPSDERGSAERSGANVKPRE